MVEMNKNVSLMIVGFISLLLAAIFVSQAAAVGNEVTTKDIKTDSFNVAIARMGSGNISLYENASNVFTLSQLRTGWKLDESQCNLGANLIVKNGSGFALTLDTHYNFTETTGVIQFKNGAGNPFINASAVNTTTAVYNYCQDDYVTASWGRTGINTTMGLYAIAALLVAVGMFFAVAKNTGVIGGF